MKTQILLKNKNNIKEKCPNCIKPDKAITPMKNGKCGACGGKGYIVWRNTGLKLKASDLFY
jgi:hypothetical protein